MGEYVLNEPAIKLNLVGLVLTDSPSQIKAVFSNRSLRADC